jgi:NAD(P)-dependent dehydrogenase (short-subunit alcohol dehydrogenase family)
LCPASPQAYRSEEHRQQCRQAGIAYRVNRRGHASRPLTERARRINRARSPAVRTPLFDQISPQHIEYMLGRIPLGRFGTSEEIAAMVAFLCSEECSFSTGAVFDLSGGRATY